MSSRRSRRPTLAAAEKDGAGATVRRAAVSDIADRVQPGGRNVDDPAPEPEIVAVLKSARAVLEHRTFSEAAHEIFETCKELIGAAAGYVALLSEDGRGSTPVFLDAGGLPCSVDQSLPMPLRGLREEACRTRRAVIENDFPGSRWVGFMPEGHARLENVLFAPLVIEQKTVGLLGLANKPGGFTEHDATLARAFGKLAAIALYNSRILASLASSQEHYRSLVEAATDAIVSSDRSGTISGWNQAASRMFGYTASQIVGKPLTLLMPAAFRDRHSAGMLRLGVTGESRLAGRILEMTGLRADGTEFPVELSIARWTAAEGVFFTGIIRDCTGRKEAERHILESEERYRAIVETSRDLIFFLDAAGRPRWQNPACRRLLGDLSERQDFFGKVHPDDSARVAAAWRAAREEEENPGNVSFRCRAADGAQVALESSFRKLSLAGETLWCVISKDVTELVKLRSKFARQEGIAGIVGRDPAMLDLYVSILDLAAADVPVLILGESGTGKELVATAIHRQGPRAGKNFVAVNCGAFADTLLETELFGHVRGAFTGAHRARKGRLELADGGTLFLDEVGDLSPAMQVRLLRFLQEGTFESVGAETTTRVDVRIISATNKDLRREIAAHRFREDLFYRLSVVPLAIPPLRERIEDIPLLAEHILGEEVRRSERRRDPARPPRKITVARETLARLVAHPWPGNVRELQNVLRFAMIKCKGNLLLPEHLPPILTKRADGSPGRKGRKPKLTSECAARAVEEAGGHPGSAARSLGVSRTTLYRHLAKLKEPHGGVP